MEIDIVPGSCHSDKEKQAAGSQDAGLLYDLSAVILPLRFLSGIEKRC